MSVSDDSPLPFPIPTGPFLGPGLGAGAAAAKFAADAQTTIEGVSLFENPPGFIRVVILKWVVGSLVAAGDFVANKILLLFDLFLFAIVTPVDEIMVPFVDISELIRGVFSGIGDAIWRLADASGPAAPLVVFVAVFALSLVFAYMIRYAGRGAIFGLKVVIPI